MFLDKLLLFESLSQETMAFAWNASKPAFPWQSTDRYGCAFNRQTIWKEVLKTADDKLQFSQMEVKALSLIKNIIN